jgi:Neuraminidase (sialidase)
MVFVPAFSAVSGETTIAPIDYAPGVDAIQLSRKMSIDDIEMLADGRLLMTCCTSPEGAICGSYSDDLGKTWNPPFTIVESPKPVGVHGYYHSSLLKADHGQLLLFYQYYLKGSLPVYKVQYLRRSIDGGKTWDDQLFAGLDGCFNDKPIRLTSGRLIVPVEKQAQTQNGDHRGYVSYVHYSDDNGMSWRKSSNEVNALPVEAQEPAVEELSDGTLVMLCRTYNGFVLKSMSSDAGVTWSKPEPIEALKISDDSSALSLKRIPGTSDLLLLRTSGGKGGSRTPLVATISKDDGKSWSRDKVLAHREGDNLGYPCVAFTKDQAIIGYTSIGGFINIARVPITWFYD